jgi:hypothetical protein
MLSMTPYYFMIYFIQLAGLCLLNWILQLLMPVIAEALLQGMVEWNTTSVVYCWMIQVLLLSITFSLRDQLWNTTKIWQDGCSLLIQRVMMVVAFLGMLWVLFSGVQLVIVKMSEFSFQTIGEFILLFAQMYCLVGIVAPMSRCVLIKGKG